MDVISHLPRRLPCLSSLGLLVIGSQGLWCSTDLVGFTGAPDPIILFPKQVLFGFSISISLLICTGLQYKLSGRLLTVPSVVTS